MMEEKACCEIRLDAPINNAQLMIDTQRILAKAPIETVIIRFGHRHGLDFGAWCFAKRSGRHVKKKVDTSTRLSARIEPIKNLASHIVTMSLTGKSLASAYTAMADWVIMGNWCEANGKEDFLNSPPLYHEALISFSGHLNTDHRAYSTRQRMQTVCRTFGEQMFPEEGYLFSNLPAIERPRGKNKNIPEPPTRQDVKTHLQTCEPLFVGITNFLVNEERFPYKLKIKNDFAWMTPDERYPLITSKILATDKTWASESMTFDYSKGCMRTIEEYRARARTTGDNYYFAAKDNYEASLELANKSTYSKYRIQVARIAHDSFVAMFTAATGINESPLRKLPWDAKYQIIQDEEVGMRVIKLRAQNKVITVRVKAPFIKHFKKFVSLRNYLCKDCDHPFLFIGFDGNTTSNYRILNTNILRRLHDRVRRLIDPDMPCLSYQSFRNYKDNYTAKEHGHEASRALLNHSERTQRNHYLKSNEQSAIDQIGKFNDVVNDFFGKPHPCSIPVGGCMSEGNPQESMQSPITVQPNCKNATGCLNCVHHKVHANHDDAWKLLSFEYVIKQMMQASASIEHFETIHGPTLETIDNLLTEMLSVNPSLEPTLIELRQDVYKNNSLTGYWQRQLERLVRLKVIA